MKKKPVIGKIMLMNIKDQPDGSCKADFEVDDVFIAYCKKEKGYKKKPTEKQIGKFITEMLSKAVKNEDGYSYQTEPNLK